MRISIVFYLFLSILSCEEKKGQVVRDDTKENYIHKPFKHLNDKWQIIVNKEDFQNYLNKYGYIDDNIVSYKDSLSVIMTAEFHGDWTTARQAAFQIGYTWTRLGYHLWLDDAEL